MEFLTELQKFDSELWYYFIDVPRQVAEHFINSSGTRVVCTLNESVQFQCALMPKGEGEHFINVNKEHRGKLGLHEGDVVAVALAADTSEYGLPMPDELRTLMDEDPAGDRLFHALTPGKQRNLLYIAGKVKSSQKRSERAYVILEHLKIHGGVIDFKALNEEMKAFRRL